MCRLNSIVILFNTDRFLLSQGNLRLFRSSDSFLLPIIRSLLKSLLDICQGMHQGKGNIRVKDICRRDLGFLRGVSFLLELGKLDVPRLQDWLVGLNIHVKVIDFNIEWSSSVDKWLLFIILSFHYSHFLNIQWQYKYLP